MGWLKRIFNKERREEEYEIPPRTRRTLTEDELDERAIKTLETKIRKSRRKMLEERYARLQEVMEEQRLEEDIAMLEQDIYGSDEDDEQETAESPDALLMQLLSKAANAGAPMQQQQGYAYGTSQPPPQNVPPPRRDFTDEELKSMRDRIPKPYLKKLAQMGDEELIETVQIHAPDFFHQASEKSIARAIELVREV